MPRIYNRLYDRRGYGGLDMADEYRDDVPKEPGNDDDSSSPLIWGLLGFFIPIVGVDAVPCMAPGQAEGL